jgi:hypothetical protein
MACLAPNAVLILLNPLLTQQKIVSSLPSS